MGIVNRVFLSHISEDTALNNYGEINRLTGEYLDEPVPFQDDAMAMLRYSIEQERRTKPKLNRGVTGGI